MRNPDHIQGLLKPGGSPKKLEAWNEYMAIRRKIRSITLKMLEKLDQEMGKPEADVTKSAKALNSMLHALEIALSSVRRRHPRRNEVGKPEGPEAGPDDAAIAQALMENG